MFNLKAMFNPSKPVATRFFETRDHGVGVLLTNSPTVLKQFELEQFLNRSIPRDIITDVMLKDFEDNLKGIIRAQGAFMRDISTPEDLAHNIHTLGVVGSDQVETVANEINKVVPDSVEIKDHTIFGLGHRHDHSTIVVKKPDELCNAFTSARITPAQLQENIRQAMIAQSTAEPARMQPTAH